MTKADSNRKPGSEAAPLESDPDKTTVLPPDSFSTDPSAELELAAADAEARVDEQRNLYLRALAELENFRKRAQRDVEQAHKYGLERFSQELLGVMDSLEAGLTSAAEAANRALLEGQEATLRLLQAAFQKFGISEINPVGVRFDPQLHEAIAMQESVSAEPDSVMQVVQKGYQLNGRLLRPARVIVARAAVNQTSPAA
jgi:molecular chaperone GrpE